MNEELRGCFEWALQEYCKEPPCVKENARISIRWGGREMVFRSGMGECRIIVCCIQGKPQYHVIEPTREAYLARLQSDPQPLSTRNLRKVRDTLKLWGIRSKELRACFEVAPREFSKEPLCVKANARLQVTCDKAKVRFISGLGKCEISVSYREGGARYAVKA
ncbi:hypothetical protein G0U57_002811, partial [Chelydra serpentina]